MARLFIGFCLLATVLIVAREPLPRERRMYAHLAVMGVISVGSLCPHHVGRAVRGVILAATLNAPVPIFVVLIAPLFLPDEKLTATKLAGVILGLLGVLVLVGFDPASIGRNDFVAELALLGAAVCYAVGTVYARRFVRGLRPMVPAASRSAMP